MELHNVLLIKVIEIFKKIEKLSLETVIKIIRNSY